LLNHKIHVEFNTVINNHISLFDHSKKAFEQWKFETGTTTYDGGMDNCDGWKLGVENSLLNVLTWLGATEITVELTTETISSDGTNDGIAVYGAITVFEPTQTSDETYEAHEAGIATGDDHANGTTTVDGTITTDDLGNEITVDETIDTTTTDGTDDGTDDH